MLISSFSCFSTPIFLPISIECFIELDDGKILTGKPIQFDGKNPWVSGYDFPKKTNPLSLQLWISGRGAAPALAPSRTVGGCSSPLAEASTGNMSSTGSN